MNVVVLRGRLSRPAEVRELPSGSRLLAYEVTVAGLSGERADSVPVVWIDGPAWAEGLAAGQEVVVAGRVRRRFFRANGSTASRTEVVAAAVTPATRSAKVESLMARVRRQLDEVGA